MAAAQPLQMMEYHDDTFHDLGLWAKRQVLRIENLSEHQVLLELQDIMKGHKYSWHCINEMLQTQFDNGCLEFSLVDGDILFEWNNLCNEKGLWERKGHLSVNNAEFNMDCLINLMILPSHARLGSEARRLVTSNMDKPNVSNIDLWAGPKDPLSRHDSTRLQICDNSSSESDDSDYADEEEESDDEVEGHGCSDDESNESDENETEDEDIEGLGMEIVDMDEISDLDL